MKISADETISSLGIGLTNRCNLNCPHCYSRNMEKSELSLEDVEKILKIFPNLKKVNFGTGESILNRNFREIIDLLRKKNIQMALTTNGLTIDRLEDRYLSYFKDIDISIDFPNAKLHDEWRGCPGLFDLAVRGIEKCRKMKINTSIVMCLMNNNYKTLPQFRTLLKRYNIFLRINLYKPVDTKRYLLNYEEFWEAMKLLFENFELVSNSEPILSIITGDELAGSPCGTLSLRIHPNMVASACVYIDGQKVSARNFQKQKELIPKFCETCRFAQSCRGGCLGRRYLTLGIKKPDIYCPLFRGKQLPKIKFKKAKEKEFIHSSYLCTIIVK